MKQCNAHTGEVCPVGPVARLDEHSPSMSEKFWYVKQCKLFERLTPEQVSRLEQRARMRRFPKSCAIYLPNDAADSVFLVIEGRIRLCAFTHDGKQATLAFIEPGELFGELSLVGESERAEHAETVSASTVVRLPKDDMERLMGESPHLTLGVTKLIGLRRRRIERRLKSLLFHSNRERVVHLLLELVEQYGKVAPEGIVLAINLSHQDLASVIGTSRETVTVLLGELQGEGLLRISRQRIVVRDLDHLARCVGEKRPPLPGDSTGLSGRSGHAEKTLKPEIGVDRLLCEGDNREQQHLAR